MSRGTLRVGVDIGGTFTNFALCDESTGRMLTHKQLTSTRDPSIARSTTGEPWLPAPGSRVQP